MSLPNFSQSSRFNKNKRRGSSPDTPPQNAGDIELRDFSHDMDLDGLGALLGSDSFSGSSAERPPAPELNQTEQKGKDKSSKEKGSLFDNISAKFKPKKKQDNGQPQGEDTSGYNFTYKPYTDEDMSDSAPQEDSRGGTLSDDFSVFEDSSPFESSSPFENSSPFETQSPFENASPFEQPSPIGTSAEHQAPPIVDIVPNSDNIPEQSSDDMYEQMFGQAFTAPDSTPTENKAEKKEKKTKKEKQSGLSDSLSVLFAAVSGRAKAVMKASKKEKVSPPPVEMPPEPIHIPDMAESADRDDHAALPSDMPPVQPQPRDFADPLPPLDSQPTEIPTPPAFPTDRAEDSAPAESTQAAPSAVQEKHSEPKKAPRTHGITDAVQARLAKYGLRLPSFKPKVYTVPPSTYEPIDDNIQSPTLAADIEAYIRQKSDLGAVAVEYDQMRDFISSVSTDARLTSEEIRPPENIREVHAAESELLDLIDQITAQNDRQRRQIGVYAARPAEDPYNYRGINDARQNYTDMDASSFSMQPRVSFESEQKIDPNRSANEQAYYSRLSRAQSNAPFVGTPMNGPDSGGGFNSLGGQSLPDSGFGDGLDDDFGADFNSLGGQSISDTSDTPDSGGNALGFEDDFDDDLGEIEEIGGRRRARGGTSGRRPRDVDRSPRGERSAAHRQERFDDELADDFDSHFNAPRVSVRRDGRPTKRASVRRRS